MAVRQSRRTVLGDRSARTLANREFLASKAVELPRSLGATKGYRVNKPPFVIHSHRTTRMGFCADDPILDSQAEAPLVKRLFIADNSALANGIGRPTPTLTTQEIATRRAERLLTRYFRRHALGAEREPNLVDRPESDPRCAERSSVTRKNAGRETHKNHPRERRQRMLFSRRPNVDGRCLAAGI
jgi:choline dehydrogenase-like flavoprotein